MSRSGFSDDGDYDYNISPWPAIIQRAVQGKPGVAFLKELLAALDAMPVKELIAEELEASGAVCALGSVGKARGLDMTSVDPEDYDRVAKLFNISRTLAREIVFRNDDDFGYHSRHGPETPAKRWERVRAWVAGEIQEGEATVANKKLWRSELFAAGWKPARGNKWTAPNGKVYRGTGWAWRKLKEQKEAG